MLILSLMLLIGFVMIGMTECKQRYPDRNWNDSEYETNRQCSFLVGEELTKCKAYFNINQ